MARRGQARSIGQDVYGLIRSSIFSGELAPGDRLQPAQLGAKYGASTTVVREALQLLAGERLVRSDAGKGFSIPAIAPREILDATRARGAVDSLALTLSIERGDVEWESEVIAAHHRLARTPRQSGPDRQHQSEEWAAMHHEFHRTLFDACGSQIILELSDQLYATTELIRVSAGPLVRSTKRDVDAEHAAIVEAVLARDAELACERLVTHYATTAHLLAGSHPDQSPAQVGAEPATE